MVDNDRKAGAARIVGATERAIRDNMAFLLYGSNGTGRANAWGEHNQTEWLANLKPNFQQLASREKEQSGYMQVVRWVDDPPNHPAIVSCRMPHAINLRLAEPQVPINIRVFVQPKFPFTAKKSVPDGQSRARRRKLLLWRYCPPHPPCLLLKRDYQGYLHGISA